MDNIQLLIEVCDKNKVSPLDANGEYITITPAELNAYTAAAISEATKGKDEELIAEKIRLARGDYGQICGYCGWETKPAGATWEELQDHIANCPEHPLHKAKEQFAATERKLAEQQAVLQLVNKAFDKTAEEYRSGYLNGGSVHTSDLRVEAWRAVANCSTEELAKLLSEAEQRGRDALMKELREQKPVAYTNNFQGFYSFGYMKYYDVDASDLQPLYANPMPVPDELKDAERSERDKLQADYSKAMGDVALAKEIFSIILMEMNQNYSEHEPMNNWANAMNEYLSATADSEAWLEDVREKVWQEVVAEWEKPWGLSNGESFEVRIRRLAASKRTEGKE
jgi:hypothetical protein